MSRISRRSALFPSFASLVLVAVTAGRAESQQADFGTQRISFYEGADDLFASTRGDFDRDGLLDVVACAGTRLVYFRGRALDGFAPPVEYPGAVGADRARDAARGDFDGDGDLDVVFGHAFYEGAAGLSVFDGDGAGGFAAPRFIALPHSAQFVFTAHLDGDGSFDLVVRSSNRDWLMTLLGDGAGGFDLATVLAIDNVHGVAVADVDSDGAEDVVYSRPLFDELVVLRSDGFGGLDEAQTISGIESPKDVLSGDFERDGAIDFAVLVDLQPLGSPRVDLYRNDGSGLLEASASYGGPPFFLGRLLALADFDGDEIADLLTVSEYDHTGSLYVGDGAGGFAPKEIVLTLTQLSSVETGDFDGDSRRDIASTGLRRVALFRGDGGGGFIRFGERANGRLLGALSLGRVDSDGLTDLVEVENGIRPDVSEVRVHAGTGSEFLPPEAVTIQGIAMRGVAGDFDADGDGDIAVTVNDSIGDGWLRLFFSDGSAVPGAAGGATIPIGVPLDAVLSSDLDGDLDTDLVVLNVPEEAARVGAVHVMLGDGSGGFEALPPVECGAGPVRVALGDFDDDGVSDLAVGKRGGSALFLLRGDGAGGFSLVASVPWPGLIPGGLAAGDFDGDGRDDVAQTTRRNSGGFQAGTARVLFRTGPFAFESRTILLAHPLSEIGAADVNDDGIADVGSTSGEFLLGDAGRDIATAVFEFYPPPVSSGSQGTLGDVDGDGLTDVIVADGVVLNRMRDPERARRGNVNAAAGALSDVLRFNGSRGSGPERRVEIGPTDPAMLSVALPPSKEGKRAKFALYEWAIPSPGDSGVNRLPLDIGFALFGTPPSLVSGLAPVRIWNNAGRESFLGTPDLPSTPAPSTVYSLPGGLGVEATLLYQGIIVDPDAPNGRGGMTNAIEVLVR